MITIFYVIFGLIALTILAVMVVALRLRKRLRVISVRLNKIEQESRWSSMQLIQMRGREIQGGSTFRNLDVRCYSQYAEEPILWGLLGFQNNGYFVEVGAYDGVRLSTSFFFESIGWHGLLIEANPELFEKCREARPGSKVINAAIGGRTASGTIEFSKVIGADGVDALGFLEASDEHLDLIKRQGGRLETIEVAFTSLAELLNQEQPDRLDLLIIDIEGLEATALEGLDLERWVPRVVMVEHNVGSLEDKYPAAQILLRNGYRLYTRCKGNDIFISRDVCL